MRTMLLVCLRSAVYNLNVFSRWGLFMKGENNMGTVSEQDVVLVLMHAKEYPLASGGGM